MWNLKKRDELIYKTGTDSQTKKNLQLPKGKGGRDKLRVWIPFSHAVMSDFLPSHGLRCARPPCPSPTPGAYSNSCPYNLDFQREKTQNNTSTFKWKLSFQGSTLGAFELFSSNVAHAKNNFVTLSLVLLQSWFMNLVRKLAPFYM